MKFTADDPKWLFFFCASSVILAVIVIFGFIFLTALPVIRMSGLYLIFGTTWDYNTHQFGMLTLDTGSVFLAGLTLLLATPVGILAAIYLAEYAHPALEKALRALIELLVGIPSVVYGIFGFLLLEPLFRTMIKPEIGSVLGFIPIFRYLNPDTGSGYLLAATVFPYDPSHDHLALSRIPPGIPIGLPGSVACAGCHTLGNNQARDDPSRGTGNNLFDWITLMRAMGETMAVVMLVGGTMHVPSSVLTQDSPLPPRSSPTHPIT